MAKDRWHGCFLGIVVLVYFWVVKKDEPLFFHGIQVRSGQMLLTTCPYTYTCHPTPFPPHTYPRPVSGGSYLVGDLHCSHATYLLGDSGSLPAISRGWTAASVRVVSLLGSSVCLLPALPLRIFSGGLVRFSHSRAGSCLSLCRAVHASFMLAVGAWRSLLFLAAAWLLFTIPPVQAKRCLAIGRRRRHSASPQKAFPRW